MRKKVKFRIGIGIVTLILLLSFPVSAAGVHGPDGYINNVFGYSYAISNHGASGSGGCITGAGLHKTQNGSVAPTGYMGIKIRIYKSDGTLVGQGPWRYSTTDVDTFSATYQTCSLNTSSYYYMHHLFDAYNGNGYWTYVAPKTPNLGF